MPNNKKCTTTKTKKTINKKETKNNTVKVSKEKKHDVVSEKKSFLLKVYAIDKYIFELFLAFVLGLIIFKVQLPKTIALLTIISNLYLVIKYKNNLPLFFCLTAICYFNYSVIASKYLLYTNTLDIVYNQTVFSNTMSVGMYAMFIFTCIIGLFLSGKDLGNTIDTKSFKNVLNDKKAKIMGYLIILLITSFTVLAYVTKSESIRALYEYSLIFFIVGFLLCKKNIIQTIILIVLMFISVALNIYDGGRIISLLPCIAFFFIFLVDYFDYKKILVVMFLGVVAMTFFGLYGDIKDSHQDYDILTPQYLVETMAKRKLTLDTSISSYWTGLTFIEQSRFNSSSYRFKNFCEYMTVYTTLGNKFGNYKHVYRMSEKRYVHYYGGYLTSYFYYWMGYVGVGIIGLYVGYLLSLMKNLKESDKFYNYKLIVIIYVCSTIPRWYLYYPSPLIRGMLLLTLFYIFVSLFMKGRFLNEKNK